MTRRLRTLLTCLSLVPFLACASLWLRSYFRLDTVIVSPRHNLATWLGGFHYFAFDTDAFGSPSYYSMALPLNLKWDDAQYLATPGSRFAGFIFAHGQSRGRPTSLGGPATSPKYVAIRIPLWLPTLLTLPLPLLRLRSLLRRRYRLKRNLCAECGYDLRQSPTQCPECGAAVPTPPASAPSVQH